MLLSVLTCRFRMKCHLCVNYIEMQTDPATCDYVIVSGASRKEERWDMAENEQILTTGRRFVFTYSFCSHCCLYVRVLPRCDRSILLLEQNGKRRKSWRRTPCTNWITAGKIKRSSQRLCLLCLKSRTIRQAGRMTSISTAPSAGSSE